MASLLGKYLSDEGTVPDVIVTSPAERARMTAELVAHQLDYALTEIQSVEGLYQASVREFIGYLGNLNQQHKTILVVGHNPAITYAADYLCPSEIGGMSPGSVVHINFAGAAWSDLSVKGSGEFINYYDVLGDH